jgi:hypothetical protein
MDKYFSLKYIISFFVGIIIYKLIQNKCSCDIVEGQSVTDRKIIKDINNSILNNDNNNKHIKDIIEKFAKITETIKDGQNNIKEKLSQIKSLSDLGDPFNSDALDIVDLIIQNFINMDIDTLRTNIKNHLLKGNEKICEMDINLYLMMFAYLLYSDSNKISSENFTNILNLSNKLSKYLPEILEKVQELYENCPKNSKYDKHKAEILNRIYHRLFKSNETVINFNGFGKLIKSLKNVKTIYIALFMVCVTFIIVKFIGVFNMGSQ